MRWANFKSNDRSNYLPQLLACVRLPLLSPHYIADRVATEELIKTSHQCRFYIWILKILIVPLFHREYYVECCFISRDLVDEAKDYHLMPERQFLIQGIKTKPRTTECVSGVIYAVGGLTKTGKIFSI